MKETAVVFSIYPLLSDAQIT